MARRAPARPPQIPGAPRGPSGPIQGPFMGLHLDRPPHIIPPTGFQACNNVRIFQNRVTSSSMGWTQRFAGSSLAIPNQPICGGGILTTAVGGYQYLVFATTTDVYSFNALAHPTVASLPNQNGLFLVTPTYTTGTASTSGTAVTGITTTWKTGIGTSNFRNNARVGDYISFGSATQNSPSATWFLIDAVNSNTSLTLHTSAGVRGAGPYTLRQCLTNAVGGVHGGVSFENFPGAGGTVNGDACFIANGGGAQSFPGGTFALQQDPIFYWAPTAPGNPISGSYLSAISFTSSFVRRFNNVMVYGRLYGGTTTGDGDMQIASSDNGLPASLSTGVSFQGTVTDGTEVIANLGVLGNSLMIYTGPSAQLNSAGTSVQGGAYGAVISAQFVGFPVIWQFSTLIRNRGLLANRLLQEFPDRHEFVTSDGQYRYNGLFIQVMNDHVWRGVIPTVDLVSVQNGFTIPVPLVGDIIWGLPILVGAASPGSYTLIGYTEHYMEQANNYLFKPHTQRDLSPAGAATGAGTDFTCYLGSAPSEFVFGTGAGEIRGSLVGDAQGNVLTLYDADTQNGAGYVSTVTFSDRIVAGERSRGLIKRVYPYAEVGGNYNLSIQLQMKDRVGGPVALTDTQTFNLLAPTARFTTHYRRGRVANLTFSTAGSNSGQPFTLDGYDWDLPSGSPGGQR